MKKYSLALLTGAALFAGIGGAYAATKTVTSDITYLSDLTITEVHHPIFGYVKQGVAGSTYTLDPVTGVVTPGAGGVLEGGATQVGDYTIKGSGLQVINITAAGSYVANGGSTPSAAVCSYDGGADSASDCVISGAAAPTTGGKDLKVGLTITSDGNTLDGTTDHPAFTLTVLYQ